MTTCGSRPTAAWIDPNLHQPYVMTWSFNPQYQLKNNYLLQIDYEGSSSVGLIETPNYNVLPETYDAGNTSALSYFVGNSQPFRPFPNYGTIQYMDNISHATFHSGTVHITKRYSSGLLFDSFFTYAKSLDGTGVGVTDVATNLYKGPSGYDRRLRYVGNFSYDIPIGKGRALLRPTVASSRRSSADTPWLAPTTSTRATQSPGDSRIAPTLTCRVSSASAAGP